MENKCFNRTCSSKKPSDRKETCRCAATSMKTFFTLIAVCMLSTSTTALSVAGARGGLPRPRSGAAAIASKCGSAAWQESCKKSCRNALAFCENSCEKPSELCSQRGERINADKMQCIAGCFRQSPRDNLQRSRSGSKNQASYRERSQRRLIPKRQSSGQNDQVLSFDVDLLLKDKAIMRKLCNTEDFKDAKACRNLANEQKNDRSPTSTAQQLQPHDKLKGERSQKQLPSIVLSQRRKTMRNRRQMRTRRSTASSVQAVEEVVCPTTTEEKVLLRAKHKATGLEVILSKYVLFGRCGNDSKYQQLFRVGSCRYNELTTDVNIPSFSNPRCETRYSQQLADFFVEVPDNGTSPFQSILGRQCEPFRRNIYACRDWVLIKSHCTLHGSRT